jgi:hypothetical protein
MSINWWSFWIGFSSGCMAVAAIAYGFMWWLSRGIAPLAQIGLACMEVLAGKGR